MTKIEPIAQTLENIFKGLSSNQKSPQQVIQEVLGEYLDVKELKHLQPWGLRDKILTINVSSPARLYTLNLKKNKLLKILQERLSPDIIREIFLRVGTVKQN